MDTIKFPLKFDSTGVQKVVDGTEDYYSQLLTIAILTEPHTHPFSPRFGVYDPTFRGIDRGLFVLNAARFVPEVEILDLSTDFDNSGTVNTVFSFRIKETG
jgi:hypothetical protein